MTARYPGAPGVMGNAENPLFYFRGRPGQLVAKSQPLVLGSLGRDGSVADVPVP